MPLCRTHEDGTLTLALFLGRRGRVKDALDVFEPLWAQTANAEAVAAACLDVLASFENPPDPAQFDRVTGWLEQAIKQKKDSAVLWSPWLASADSRCATMKPRHFTRVSSSRLDGKSRRAAG